MHSESVSLDGSSVYAAPPHQILRESPQVPASSTSPQISGLELGEEWSGGEPENSPPDCGGVDSPQILPPIFLKINTEWFCDRNTPALYYGMTLQFLNLVNHSKQIN